MSSPERSHAVRETCSRLWLSGQSRARPASHVRHRTHRAIQIDSERISPPFPDSVLEEGLDDVIDAQMAQVGVGLRSDKSQRPRVQNSSEMCTHLTASDEEDRLARDVGHRKRGADLVVLPTFARCEREPGHREREGDVRWCQTWSGSCRPPPSPRSCLRRPPRRPRRPRPWRSRAGCGRTSAAGQRPRCRRAPRRQRRSCRAC